MEVKSYCVRIVWLNVLFMVVIHVLAFYGYYLLVKRAHTTSLCWYFFLSVFSGMGITAGAHRLWSHRSYKARLPYRIIMMLLQTMAMQNSIFTWCRDHRMHHKYSETDADPHNIRRGFFFAHCGWLMCKKHWKFHEKKANIPMDDVWQDPVVVFQYQNYALLVAIFGIIVPTMVPILINREEIWVAFMTCTITRYVYVLHSTWLVNSVAHMWGAHQYDRFISPSESRLCVFGSFGEGYHNYHHTFPYDYSASEFDWRFNFNFTTFYIDAFAALGWVYERRRVSSQTLCNRVEKTGDKSEYGIYHAQVIQQQPKYIFLQTMTAGLHFWVPILIRQFTIESQT